jgi:hypothetical protein
MKKIYFFSLALILGLVSFSQTPVPMSSQPGLSYTEDFSDIANWTNGFVSGTGASRFGSVAVNASGTIPDGVRITTATTSFTSGTSGGVQKGTGSIVLLSTGSTDNTSSAAIDFFMDFTGVNAGSLSFDRAEINNSTGDRRGSIRVYYSTDGSNYTELTGAQVLNVANNTPASGTINVSLPSAFNNTASARLRFYYYNGTGGSSGSRPKISIDNLTVTAHSSVVSTVSVSSGSDAAEPATNGTFNISLSSPAPAGGVTISYTLGGTAVLNTDYTDPQSGSIIIAEGNNSGVITLNIVNDAVVEATKIITINLTGASNGFAIGTSSADIALTDDDTPPYISLTGTYTQNFNSLASSGSSIPWTDNVTIPGWYSSRTIYNTGTGSSNGGALYSFGTSGSNERALGSVASGSTGTLYYGARFINNTGTTITSLKVTYTGEQWRNSANASAQTLNFAYLTSPEPISSLTAGTWTAVSSLDFTGPVTGGTASAIDGNAADNSTLVSFTIYGLNIAPGDELFIRWDDPDDSGSDHGLGIDDLTVEANPVDHDAPVVTSLTPANGATDVATNLSASIVFNEPVQKGSGTIVIRKTSDNSIAQTVNVSDAAVNVSGTTVSFNLSGLSVNTGYYIEMGNGVIEDISGNDFAGFTGSSAWAFTTGTVFYVANFQNCATTLTDGFTQYSVTGDISWACTPFGRDPLAPSGTAPAPYGVQINGFAGGTNVANIDWLISPSFDLTGTVYPLLSFWSRTAFNGLPLQLKVSTDYTGGDPRLATWTDINGRFPLQTSNVWTLSSNINLAAFKAPNVHFAFVYTSTDEDGARWTLDDISLANSPTPPPPSLTTSTTDIQFTYVAAGSNAVKTFNFTGNDLTQGVTITSTGAFEVSKNGTAFSSSISYSVEEANNVNETVYVRFAPSQKNQDYSGTITVTTGDLSDLVSLKGTSIDPATTLEVVNWNIEWFGSTANGPANDNQQEQNVKTVLQNVGADIYGLVEVVDETRLANIVSQMPGYTYVIGNYGSHVNPPDQSGGPLSEAQKLAFVYKTSMFSNVTVRPLINNQNTSSDSYNYWSSGRYPFLMTADVTLNCVTKRINFILVHAKANTSPTATAYARRQASARELHDTIQTYFADENVIVLGDFNDDLDQTITSGITPPVTSYNVFTTDNANFFSPTLSLSLAGKKSTVSYNDMIDHVMLSNEMEAYYMPSTASVLTDVTSLVTNYGSTTTDHYPVFTRYKFEAPAPPTVTSCTTALAFCSSTSGNYTIPVFTATSVCGSVSYSYEITGATNRTGTTNDASGHFEVGTSTITWSATDGAGNTTTCQTTVVVNGNPVVTIPDAYALTSGVLANTVYIGYTPASSLTLHSNVSGGTADYTYSWSNGSQDASATVHPTANTVYTLTVTDVNGCVGTASKAVSVMDVRAGKKLDKVSICHASGNTHTIEIATSAVADHLAHGDMLGGCEMVNPSVTGRFQPQAEMIAELQVKVLPNPSVNSFVLNLNGGAASEKITIRITDVTGRTIEIKNNLSSNKNITIGNTYRPGIYFAEVVQGSVRQQIKLVKLGN